MLALHRRLRSAGPSEGLGPGTLATALRDARADACHAAAGDPVVTAAGWSFIARNTATSPDVEGMSTDEIMDLLRAE